MLPQNPAQNPQSPFKDKNQDCSIEVNFKGYIASGTPAFDNGPDHKKLGNYVGRLDGYTVYGLRFEVRGSVTNGTIGRIGNRDLQNGGEWTIEQTISPLAGSNRNGKPVPRIGEVFDDSPKYLASDNAGSVTVAVNGGTFAWHDGPGFMGDKDMPILPRSSLAANFSVSVRNGTKVCQVGFYILEGFEKGRWVATIRPGYLHRH